MRRPLASVVLGLALAAAATACGTTGAGPVQRGRPPTTFQREFIPLVTVAAAPQEPRALLVGDSTLLAVYRYDAFGAFRGFGVTYDAESCRTLGIPSCGPSPVPPNAVETIGAAVGTFDTVVIMAGYDEWWTSFPSSFDEVIAAARAKGADHIVWLTYREGVGYTAPDGATANEAFVKNNATLRAAAASGAYPDLVLADWFRYTKESTGWLAKDGIHLTPTGALAVADYISRTLAHIDGRPCPMPWEVGGVVDTPCGNPDDHAPVADLQSLYAP